MVTPKNEKQKTPPPAADAKSTNGATENNAPGKTFEQLWEGAVTPDQMAHLDKLKGLYYGPTGAGKTELTSLFERPLIAVTELQAVPTIRRANPKARIIKVTNSQEINDFRKLIRDPELPKHVDAVVLDSLTDVQRIIKDAYVKNQSSGRQTADMDTWGLIIDLTARMARELRDVPVHVAVICLDTEIAVEGQGRVHRPSVNGKSLPNDLAQYFNLVGYVSKQQREGGVRHEVLFNGPDNYLTKGMRELDDIEAPEPLLWISKIFGTPLDPVVAARVKAWKARAETASDGTDNVPEPLKAEEGKAKEESKTKAGEADPFKQ